MFLTTDQYLSAFPTNYHKMDVFYHGPTHWRGQTAVPPSSEERLIVAGHSDYPLTDEIVNRYPLATWWATNNRSLRGHGLPLGITNDTQESNLHAVYGNTHILTEVANTPRNVQGLVYMNFVIDTYPQERKKVWDMFANKPWVTVGTPVPTLEGRKQFLTDIRNHSYVLCPRGNGVDTHRLWETLYLGSIPVVLWDTVHSGWTDLPILFVNSWEEVTEDRLQREEVRFRETSWNLEKLTIDYWVKRICKSSQ